MLAPLDADVTLLAALANSAPPNGDPLPRIVCPEGYQAYVYASDLTSPHGLAFSPEGVLYVAEETAGHVSRIDPGGASTPVVKGLARPEGIDFDAAGNLYVVEDVQNGRLLRVDPSGEEAVLTTHLNAPEDVVWSADDRLYITESNVQFVENIPWDVVSGVTRVTQDGEVTKVFTDTLLWSYSAVALGADGLLYVANEASNVATTDSVFRVDPSSGARTIFASELTTPEGLSFSSGGLFPLYVTEEDLGNGQGRLSVVWADGAHTPLCTGFKTVEDVVADEIGNLYISEDGTGLIVQIIVPDLIPPSAPQNLVVDPPDWTATDSFTVTWENPTDASGMAGAYLKLGIPPASATDGVFYAGEAVTQVTDITTPGAGAHPVYVWLEDGEGNADQTNAARATLHYDPDPPDSPLDLSVDPEGWTPTNSFRLSWTNPPEVSGVKTACYRLDAPPASTEDVDSCHEGASIDSLDRVAVPDSGQYAAYVWLVDETGNTDPATAAKVTLHLDAVPPTSSASVPPTTDIAPIRVTWVASDTHSGVESVALWVKVDEGGTWTESGLWSRADGPGFFLYQPSGEGTYFFATRAVDRAGNAEVEPSGEGDAQTYCETWQRAYLPLLWKDSP